MLGPIRIARISALPHGRRRLYQGPTRARKPPGRTLAELEETLAVLSDPEALADIREVDAAYRRGDVVSVRRGTYRVLYRIKDEDPEAVVLRIEHRGAVYR